MRIYGRENSAVVKATKAVSATRNTLNGSTKNCSSSATIGPSAITRRVSSAAAAKVARLIAALAPGAQRLCPSSASSTAPATGMTSTSAISKSVFLQLFHMLDVPANVKPVDQAVQHPGNQHDLQRHGERGGKIQMRLAGGIRDDQRRGGKRRALPGEKVDQGEDAALR